MPETRFEFIRATRIPEETRSELGINPETQPIVALKITGGRSVVIEPIPIEGGRIENLISSEAEKAGITEEELRLAVTETD